MVAVVKVETFDVNVTAASGQTHTLTNTLPALGSGFVRRTTSIEKGSGPTGSTGNSNPNICHCGVWPISTTQLQFAQNSSTSQKVVGEVWRYTGAASGPDEFINRGTRAIALTGTTASDSTITGIVNVDKCIPFYVGCINSNTSVNDYDASGVAVWLDSNGHIQLERGASTGSLTVYVTVVEFTGSNWKVGHGRSAAHDTSDPVITLNTASDGLSGNSFSVPAWDKAIIIEGSLEGDTGETGLSDVLGCWIPQTATNQVQFLLHQDGSARNDGKAYCHVLAHEGLVINRTQNDNWAEGNGTYASATWPSGASTTESLDELSLEWFADTTGTGTAHARGRVSGRINTASSITAWVHRSGNNVRITYGVAELAGIDGSVYGTITDVDGDNVVGNAQLNIVVTGIGFGATQGAGTLTLTQNSDGSGTNVSQTNIDSWNDTTIQFDIAPGVFADSYCYLEVDPAAGQALRIAIQVGVPPETYKEAIGALTPAPDHYWTFQNNYNDEIGTATANNSGSGTSFQTDRTLCKGDGYSMEIDTITDYCSPADQSDMNTSSSATHRYMGGWVQLDRIIQALSVIWEEGAQVNNYALLVGFGNAAMWQFADDQGDYVQAYQDIKLTPGRPYHMMMEFKSATYGDSTCVCWLDGVKQTRTNGNPWEVNNFPSHSGNISWGHEGTENLQTGDSRGVDNVDIAFASPVEANYAHWVSLENQAWSDDDIRVELFAKGAKADQTISGDTEANMQIAVDALADTVIPDWPCGIEIGNSSDGSFELTFDNITFNERCSMPIRYMGSNTLTLVMENGSDLDETKCEAPYGGTIVVQRPAAFTVEGLINGCEFRIYDDNDATPGGFGDELDGIETLSGTTFIYNHDGTTNTIIVQMIATGYREIRQSFTLSAGNQTLAVLPIAETNI